MTNVSRKWKLGMVVPAAVAMGMAGCTRSEPSPRQEEPPKVVGAQVLEIGNRSAAGRYPVSGTIKSVLNATLSSKVMGRVVEVAVREGDEIRQGQSLVRIDSRELASAVEMADASYRASVVGVGSARTAAAMESKSSTARIVQAESQVAQARAALAGAEARRDLARAGSRTQEVAQAQISVAQADSSLKLAKLELDRTARLVQEGALARRELDLAQNRYELAEGNLAAAKQAESTAREGSRVQEIRAAEQAVEQATASLRQARAGVLQARAASMQVDVRRKDIELANAQTQQSAAAARAARVGLSYGVVASPFNGRVVGRLVDPGSMASPGVPLLLVEGGVYRLEAVVPERLLAGLSKGTTASVEIDALPGRTISGTVSEIVPQGDPASHSFLVKYSLSPAPGIRSGMFGRAFLRTAATNRVLIPKSATWLREGLNYVFALNKEGIARLRIVTLGGAFDDQVEVLSGLGNGDRIVVGDRSKIEDGVKVEAN